VTELSAPTGLLLVLLGEFHDDVSDFPGKKIGPRPTRAPKRRVLDELTSIERDTLAGSTSILLVTKSFTLSDATAGCSLPCKASTLAGKL